MRGQQDPGDRADDAGREHDWLELPPPGQKLESMPQRVREEGKDEEREAGDDRVRQTAGTRQLRTGGAAGVGQSTGISGKELPRAAGRTPAAMAHSRRPCRPGQSRSQAEQGEAEPAEGTKGEAGDREPDMRRGLRLHVADRVRDRAVARPLPRLRNQPAGIEDDHGQDAHDAQMNM